MLPETLRSRSGPALGLWSARRRADSVRARDLGTFSPAGEGRDACGHVAALPGGRRVEVPGGGAETPKPFRGREAVPPSRAGSGLLPRGPKALHRVVARPLTCLNGAPGKVPGRGPVLPPPPPAAYSAPPPGAAARSFRKGRPVADSRSGDFALTPVAAEERDVGTEPTSVLTPSDRVTWPVRVVKHTLCRSGLPSAGLALLRSLPGKIRGRASLLAPRLPFAPRRLVLLCQEERRSLRYVTEAGIPQSVPLTSFRFRRTTLGVD